MAPIGATSHPSTVSIVAGPTQYIGKNFTVYNNSTGLNISVPITSKSVINAYALNIGSNVSTYTNIDNTGNFNTAGYVYSNALAVNDSNNNQNFSVSDLGVMTLASNATINGTLAAGATTVNGSATITGTTSIGGSIVLNNNGLITTQGAITAQGVITAASFVSDAAISSIGDLTVGTGFKVTALTGAVNSQSVITAVGGLVSGATISALGDLTVGTGFTVTASNGAVTSGAVTSGSITASGDLIVSNASLFKVNSSTGDVTVKGSVNINGSTLYLDAASGYVSTQLPLASYVLPDSATSVSTTLQHSVTPVSTTSSTSTYLTSQQYVDTQIWNVKKSLNDILNMDSTTVESFNNILDITTALAGSTAATALSDITSQYNGLVINSSQINTSVSTVIAQAYNTIPINNCSAVWGGNMPALPIPGSISALTQADGWYYKNFITGSTYKANWYMPVNKLMKLSDIQNLFVNLFAASDVSLPYLQIYTKPIAGSSKNYSSWAGSRINYEFLPSITSTTVNKSYCLYTGVQPMNVYNATPFACTTVTTCDGQNKSSTGGYGIAGSSINYSHVEAGDNSEILYICIGTNSASVVGNVEFSLNSINIEMATGTTQMTFSNASAMSNFMFYKTYGLNQDLTTPTAAVEAHYDQFFSLVPR